MSKLTNHERKDKVKWVITAIAFVLAFVMIIGVFMQTFMPEGQRPTDWFDKQPAQEEELPEEQPEDDGGAVIDQTSDNGVKVMTAKIAPEQYAEYGVSTLAENAYTLTATVSGDADAAVTYSAAWKNPSSEWATGKTVSDYVTVSQGSVGSQTATVSVLQAFSEQVIITACVTDYPDISATCTVDYVATFDITSNTTLADLNSKFSFDVTDVVGTLECDVSNVVSFEVGMSFMFYGDLSTKLGSLSFEQGDKFTVYSQSLSSSFDFSGFTSSEYLSTLDMLDMYYEEVVTEMSYEEFMNAVNQVFAVSRTPYPVFTVTVTVGRGYNDQRYGEVTETFNYTVMDTQGVPTFPTDITLDSSGIIAG